MAKGKVPSVKVGDKFTSKTGEEYVVVSYRTADLVGVKFLETGNVKISAAKEVKSGAVKNPLSKSVYGRGCFGEGPYKAKVDGKFTAEYQLWIGMMTRVYNEGELGKHPTYDSVSVCEEWLNFQTFATWLQDQKGFKVMDPTSSQKRMALDKDLLIPNNRVYRPEACCFLPNSINVALKGRQANKTEELPSGVYWHNASNSYTSSFCFAGTQEHLGCFQSPQDASRAFRERKTRLFSELAEKYKEFISEAAYNALINFNMDEREVYNSSWV